MSENPFSPVSLGDKIAWVAIRRLSCGWPHHGDGAQRILDVSRDRAVSGRDLRDGTANRQWGRVLIKPICVGCNKNPDEIQEYVEMAGLENMTPDDFVREEEGTFNRSNGHFLCTDCYIAAGMPSSPEGWVAP